MAILQPNPLLQFVTEMMNIVGESSGEIVIPSKYREKVLAVKNLLQSDTSGMVNSILDYAIDAASVQYSIECKNKELSKLLNDWLIGINASMRGKIPTGVGALSKEYFRERWKGSSCLLLRTFWEKKDGISLPTTLFYVDGEDIIEIDDAKSSNIDSKKFYLRIDSNKDHNKLLPTKDESIFVQKPYDAWGSVGSTPFVIARGIFRNLKFLELLEKKGEFVVSKALEYVALLKKGTEAMALTNNPDFVYSQEDLENTKNDIGKFLKTRKYENGTPTYVTNFDTTLEHIIPEYERALKEQLYAPIEKRIIAGLGLIEIASGITMTRRESVLMPKPFYGEVNEGVNDYKAMLLDVIFTMADKNRGSSAFKDVNTVKIHSSAVKDSINERMIAQIRAGYDRGVVSKQTYIDTLGFTPEVEVARRKEETSSGLDDTLYPPVITNVEKDPDAKNDIPKADDEVKEDKKSTNKDPIVKTSEKASVEIDERFQAVVDMKKIEVLEKQEKLLTSLEKGEEDSDELSARVEAKRLEVLEKQSQLLSALTKNREEELHEVVE